jgi:uncharacterized protein YpuA (DUF1002 family)
MESVAVTIGLALWNLLITVVMGLTSVVYKQSKEKVKEQGDELARITILLNRTREEIARDNVTKAEVERITDHIDQRFNKLEEKIDQLLRKGQ